MRKTLARRWLAALLTLALALSLAPASLAADPPTVTVSPSTLTLAEGKTSTLTALVSNSTETNPTVTWSSSQINVATVDEHSGLVTAIAPGRTMTTATYTYGNPAVEVTDTCELTVTAAGPATTPATYKQDKDHITVKVGDTEAVPTIKQTTAGSPETPVTGIIWESDNKNIAIVENGGVKGVKDGTTTIRTALPNDSSQVFTCYITVEPATLEDVTFDVSMSPEKLEFGGDAWLTISNVKAVWSDKDKDGNNRTTDIASTNTSLTWSASSNDPAVVVPVRSGRGISPIRIHASGKPGNSATVTVTVSYKGKPSKDKTVPIGFNDKTRVIITEYNTPNSEVTGSSVYATVNTTKKLYAFVTQNETILDKKDAAKYITWNSSNKDIVAVKTETDGSVTLTPGSKTGQATITATYDNTENGIKKTGEVICVVQSKSGGGTGEDPGGDEEHNTSILPKDAKVSIQIDTPKLNNDTTHVMEPGSENITASVTLTLDQISATGQVEWTRDGKAEARCTLNKTNYNILVTVESTANAVATIVPNGTRANIIAGEPGTATIKFSVPLPNTDIKAELPVEVSGFKLLKDKVSIVENGTMDLKEIIEVYGSAKLTVLACWSDASNIAAYVDGKVAAYTPGKAGFTVGDTKRGFKATFDVTVTADPYATIPQTGTITIKSTDTLPFSDLLSSFRRQAGGKLAYITGLNMDSSQGALYYKYNADTASGTGVGSENYYHPYSKNGVPTGRRSLEDITFVPKPDCAGEVVINYTGVSEDGKNYVCKLLVTVDPESGVSAGISYTTPYNTPFRLGGDGFSRVCREHLGSNLDYVTFSQPPERQGKLYTNYVSAGNYGRPVEMGVHYNQKALDDVWFVPAPGYSGRVTVYYTIFGRDGKSETGQVDIYVNPENGVAIGGLTYDIAKGGVARFDDSDFDRYCRQVLDYGHSLSYIRFNALPSEEEGVLYTGYSSVSNPGSRASADTTYYYGSRKPRIDQLAFIPADGFVGTVKLPFTGCTVDGTRFTGNVEVNVRGGVSVRVGEITYVCRPGRSVSFNDSDFNRLCRDVTGSSLNYISFRSLPSSSDGILYYNSSRANTYTNYRNGSSTPRIDNLSFTASSRFDGTVDIPFTARATNGDTFRAVVTIGSSSSALSGGSSGSSGSTGGYWGASSSIFTDMAGYTDVQRAAVDFLYNRNITRGLTTTQYGPQNSIRRGDFARMLYQAFAFTPSSSAQVFADVPPGAYYAEAVNALYSRGVVSGIGGGWYAPDSTLTRQDAVCMVQRAMRAAGYTAYDGSTSTLYSYNDGSSVAGYAQGAMAFAVQNGYLPTYGGWLNPTQALTRIDMAEILYRVLG